MKSLKFFLFAGAALLAPVAISAPAAALDEQPAAAAPAADENAKLTALFAEDDEANLKRNPIFALFRGDTRYADQFGDYISDAYYNAERKAGEDNLTKLATIDRAKLNPTMQIAYDVFKENQNNAIKGLTKEIMDLTVVRPINHFSGFQTFYPTFSSGQGAAQFKTVEDYDNNLKRHAQFITLMEASIGRFREGMASGVFETKLTINNVISQLDTQLAQPLEESPYYGPIKKFPEGISEADKARLTAAYTDTIMKGIYPVNQKLRDFLKNEYLPVAREGVGLSYMKGGKELYDYMIEQTTTLPLKADDVHNIGLSEVDRIHKEMDAIKDQVGFKGTRAEFFNYLRTDPKFKTASREALTQNFYDIGKKVDAVVSTQFKKLPKSPLEIRPYPEFREKFEAGGSYEPGTLGSFLVFRF